MRGSSQRRFFAGLLLLLIWQSGCAAFRPVHGVPARYLPSEMKVGDRSSRKTINPSLLGQAPPPAHLIDTADVLGVYIEGVVGRSSDPPPVHFPLNNESAPSFGLPFPVRDDGTISLPYIGSIYLRGLTVMQAEEKVTRAYLEPREILKRDTLRVQVNLQRPRQYRVLVIRQDSRAEPPPNAFMGQLNIGMVKRGTGKIVNLPAYSNDVLNALTATDGLPGLDAENAVYVIRRRGNRSGPLDPAWPIDFDPATLIRQSKEAGPVIRGQSPQPGDSAFFHSADIVRSRDPNQRGSNLFPPVIQDVPPLPNSQQMAGFGSAQRESIQPPRIWGDRTGNSFDSAAMNAPYVAGASGQIPDLSQQPMGFAGPTPIESAGNAASNNLPPSPYGQSGPVNYPPPNQPMGNYPSSGYPSSGYPPAGYPGSVPPSPGFNSPEYSQGMMPSPAAAPQQPMGMPSMQMPPVNGGPAPGYPNFPNVPPGAAMAPTPAFGTPSGQGLPDPRMQLELNPGHAITGNGVLDGRQVVRIPIRLGPGETADIRPEDVILHDGDIVFIESRDTEVFYTGGLLGGGQYMLPRDYDLDILQAMSLAQSRTNGSIGNAIGGISALNNDVSISPSTAIVLRKLPDGGEVPIKVDLYRARTDLSERIVIQPGDFILLQYTPLEAVAAFFERHLLETALFSLATQQFNRNGSGN